MKIIIMAVILLLLFCLGEACIISYFYRRTMKRSKTKVERTIKMAGTDWNQYRPLLKQRKEALLSWKHEDVYIRSFDGLRLHATYFPNTNGYKLVICFHGYTGQGMKDFIGLSGYYHREGYQMLLVDARAHGDSEGEHIGFGYLDRKDAAGWIDWGIEHCGKDVEILLHGISMGGATVLMAGGMNLPGQVKGIISDCGFTSPKYVFTHVLHSMYHMPAFPIIPITGYINKKQAGFDLDDCNAAREVRKLKVPVLLIHGEADGFVPVRMCHEIYDNCVTQKRKLIIPGAAHAECYFKDMKAYEHALDVFTEGVIAHEDQKRV